MSTLVKTPYEIRLELLQLAYDILHGKAISDSQVKAKDDGKPAIAIAPTTEDILREAEKLNEFISTSKQDKPK